jgi:predicted AAA+ superfamily ATPase
MKRLITDELLKWKNDKGRKPLLLEGVRQCGKTYILKEFGKQNYKNTVYINFEDTPKLGDIFEQNLDPKRIVEDLGIILREKINPGSTLIIFDEIQDCNRALTSLKYFCEDAPEYHVAGAGSLLGVLTSKPHSFPVGKVDRLKMGPMCFKEFLLANSEEMLVEHIEKNNPTEKLSDPLANRLKRYLDQYFAIGGMPAVVESWTKEKDIEKVEKILDTIINDYTKTFSKHAPELLTKLMLIWKSVPIQLAKENNKFIFGHVKTGQRSKDLEDALEWLIDAGFVHKVTKADKPEVPLPMNVDPTSFKIYLADVGIFRKMADLPPSFSFGSDKKFHIYRGAASENFVLNELIASTGKTPYYWRSQYDAEVDFVIQMGLEAVPIEVKAGGGKARSLSEYIGLFSPKVAVTASSHSGRSGIVSSIPLYLAWRIPDHVSSLIEDEPGKSI